jgi:hypothetical protein
VSPDGDDRTGVRLSRFELLGGAGFLLLLSVGVVRMVTPGREPLRPVSIEGIEIPSEPIATGQRLVREKEWRPPTEVYVVGWSYSLGSSHAEPELTLLHGQTVLFYGPRAGASTQNPAFLDAGLGYRLQANQPLTLRFAITNTGPPGHTLGVRALVYFVPVAGN